MLTSKTQEALNKQLNAELYSSYLYLSMSAFFESQSLAGMANWMRIQAEEELGHALKFFDFINERNGRVVLAQVDAPEIEWGSVLDAFKDTLTHEQKVTSLINELVNLSISEKDHAANAFLQWFVTEQVEEESAAQAIVDKLKLTGQDGMALFMLDAELGQRTPPPATPQA